MLLHLFLKRRYERIDIVFVRHTHEAQEVDEETFFYGRETGGTVVSTALKEMLRVVRDRYPAAPLVSYQINRQLSGWILPPLVFRAFGAHCPFLAMSRPRVTHFGTSA